MGEQRLRALRVRLPAEDAAAGGHADGERCGEVAGRAMAQPGRLRHDLVVGRVHVVGELDLHARPQAVGRHADRDADDAGLADRRVEAAVRAEALLQPVGAAEHATEVADVLAEHDHRCRRVPSPSRARRGWPRSSSWPASSGPSRSRCSTRWRGSVAYTSSNIVDGARRVPALHRPVRVGLGERVGDERVDLHLQRLRAARRPTRRSPMRCASEPIDRVAEREPVGLVVGRYTDGSSEVE